MREEQKKAAEAAKRKQAERELSEIRLKRAEKRKHQDEKKMQQYQQEQQRLREE